ncbi:MAG: NUDIX hydrolase [Sandaracinaceae bacterium]
MDGFVAAVSVLVVREGKVLAMRRAAHKVGAGLWETVSGRIDRGEDPIDAARREAREETGLDVVLEERPIDAYAARRGEAPMIVIVYRASWIAGEVERSDEHDDHAWWDAREFRAHSTLTRLADAIDRALSDATSSDATSSDATSSDAG